MTEQVKALLQDFNDVVPRIQNLYGGCQELKTEIEERVQLLVTFINNINYLPNLVAHTMYYLDEFEKKFRVASGLYFDEQYHDAGLQFGQLVQFIFYSILVIKA